MPELKQCKFTEQSCYKARACTQDLVTLVTAQAKEYGQSREDAEVVVKANWSILSRYCMWREAYHYPVYNFDAPRNRCECSKPAYIWDGEKSICLDCVPKREESV